MSDPLPNELKDFDVHGVTVRVMRITGEMSAAARTANDGWVTIGIPSRWKHIPKELTDKHKDFFWEDIKRQYANLGVELKDPEGYEDNSQEPEVVEPEIEQEPEPTPEQEPEVVETEEVVAVSEPETKTK